MIFQICGLILLFEFVMKDLDEMLLFIDWGTFGPLDLNVPDFLMS